MVGNAKPVFIPLTDFQNPNCPADRCRQKSSLLKVNANCLLQPLVLKQLKSSDAKASKCHLKFSSRMIIFIKLQWQLYQVQ